MGTKKYPEENAFSQFIGQNGGYYDGCTRSDETTYYCSTKTDSLAPLLDRLIYRFSCYGTIILLRLQ
jgi:secreted Zn-dependent insulinase-like peptidase